MTSQFFSLQKIKLAGFTVRPVEDLDRLPPPRAGRAAVRNRAPKRFPSEQPLFGDPGIHRSDSLTQFILHRAIGDAPAAFNVILITDRLARAAALTPSICRVLLAAKLTSLAWRNVLCSSRCAWYSSQSLGVSTRSSRGLFSYPCASSSRTPVLPSPVGTRRE